MAQVIKPIHVGGVNSFLISNNDKFILVDTGMAYKRDYLESEMEKAGCKPGLLNLIVLTHGDIDHIENCVYIRDKFNAKVAMHFEDEGMVEKGDMAFNRKAKSDRISTFGRVVMSMSKLLKLFNQSDRYQPFTPDIYVVDGQSLMEFGINATIVHIPGHSKGSIGVLTSEGDLICGDLLMNVTKPDLHFLIDDMKDANVSIEKLGKLGVKKVYPGHGKPFALKQFKVNIGNI